MADRTWGFMQQHWLEGDELKPQVTRRVAFLGGSEKPLQDSHRFWEVPVLQHMIVGLESPPDNGMCCESPRGFSPDSQELLLRRRLLPGAFAAFGPGMARSRSLSCHLDLPPGTTSWLKMFLRPVKTKLFLAEVGIACLLVGELA